MKFEITTAKEFQRGYDRKQIRTPIASEQTGDSNRYFSGIVRTI
jgi:hypothetical protein